MKYTPQSAETDPGSYPEGGWNAWSVVLGSWMASFSTIGMMNSLGIFQTYLEEHQPREYSSGKIGWILGIYSFLAFFSGIQVGPIFDAKGPRILVACGGTGTVLSMILLGFCTRYWHFMLVFGVLGGVSVSLAFNPAISIVAHYFRRRRGLATGVASSGASCGGVVFPLLFQSVSSRIGFARATRVIALVDLVAFSAAILLIRSRLSPKATGVRAMFPDLSLLCNRRLMLASMGIFFMKWGLFFSFLLLSLLNAGSVFGRWIPGYCADRIGRFNTLIITILDVYSVLPVFGYLPGLVRLKSRCFLCCLGLSVAVMLAWPQYALVNCANLNNMVATMRQLTLFSVSAGQILTAWGGEYTGLIAFAAASYAASFICLVLTKLVCCGWSKSWAIF
ncbi:hypothetical protein N7507_002456 [Penicillium longicatenatum]|nr:hypothetical protein N7507_002456 [Penicillium longicatenatum]